MESNKRVIWLDSIRLLAFLFLVMCHAAAPFNAAATYGTGDQVSESSLLWGAIVGIVRTSLCASFRNAYRSLGVPRKNFY